jgi:hypothetical protein
MPTAHPNQQTLTRARVNLYIGIGINDGTQTCVDIGPGLGARRKCVPSQVPIGQTL